MPPQFLLSYCRLPPFYGKGATADSAKQAAYLRARSEIRHSDQGIASAWHVTSRASPELWECSYFVITNATRNKLSNLEKALVDHKKIRVVFVEQNHNKPDSFSKDISSLLQYIGGFQVIGRTYSDIPSVTCQSPDIVVVPHQLGNAFGHMFVSAYHARNGSGEVVALGQRLKQHTQEYYNKGCSWLVPLSSPDWKLYFFEALRQVCAGMRAQDHSNIIVSKKFRPLTEREIYKLS